MQPTPPEAAGTRSFAVLGAACITGAGRTEPSLEAFGAGRPCAGTLPNAEVCADLPPRSIRRLKRLPRLVLALSEELGRQAETPPRSVYLGTGWGPLSETSDFLKRLFKSCQRLSSPTDFVGSVHNAPAGQAAIRFGARGPNVTATAGDLSFEEALLLASLTTSADDLPLLLLGADEHHEELSPLLDPSTRGAGEPSDGGGALLLGPADGDAALRIVPRSLRTASSPGDDAAALVEALGGPERIVRDVAAVLVGLPAATRDAGQATLDAFLERSGLRAPAIDYRRLLGEHASASAAAAALACRSCAAGELPASLCGGQPVPVGGRSVLMLSFAEQVAAVELIVA